MKSLVCFSNKLEHLCKDKSFKSLSLSSFRKTLFYVNSFWVQLIYFLIISFIGYLALKLTNPRPNSSSFELKNMDIFFTSVSASTVSSMSTVEMEVFSNTQLVIITILMLLGGEVFNSMLELYLQTHQLNTDSKVKSLISSSELVPVSDSVEIKKQEADIENRITSSSFSDDNLKFSSMKSLCQVVLGYFLVVHLVGSSSVALYTGLVMSARRVLSQKGLRVQTFSVFTVVSTFANCGFIPTNENMIIFRKNSGLLLLLIPLILLGNTLYGPSLKFVIWVLEKVTKRVEYSYILKNHRDMGYSHLLSGVESRFLVLTVVGFMVVQLIVFCGLEWNNHEVMGGLSWFEKLVAALFEVANSRHAGESFADLSLLSPAVLVTFIVMMYLPPYTSFLPTNKEEVGKESKREKNTVMECLLFSQLSYLAIFIVLICILERHKLQIDPLNFNVLNITLEVISAYGNVGFSTGYSCGRQIKPNGSCKDASFGFAGRWSNSAKFVLIIVMFFGRLKKFNVHGGKAWKLS